MAKFKTFGDYARSLRACLPEALKLDKIPFTKANIQKVFRTRVFRENLPTWVYRRFKDKAGFSGLTNPCPRAQFLGVACYYGVGFGHMTWKPGGKAEAIKRLEAYLVKRYFTKRRVKRS